MEEVPPVGSDVPVAVLLATHRRKGGLTADDAALLALLAELAAAMVREAAQAATGA